ncbi:hypothetical protein ACH4PW_20210 [Streptomyces sp. NPDC017082]|uniref:hypothetical protein n=1 Tax=Streptomyces sp. NPDC017082 TaxID=3364974 RepID=UPI00379E1B15
MSTGINVLNVIEIDGWPALVWAAVLLAPSALVSSALLFPLRARLRGRLVLGWLTVFLTAVLLSLWTPGLRLTSLWPALCLATVSVPLAAWARKRDGGRRDG